MINAVSDAFVEASGQAEDTPGQTTAVVRAYASVLLEGMNSTDAFSNDLETAQVCVGVPKFV